MIIQFAIFLVIFSCLAAGLEYAVHRWVIHQWDLAKISAFSWIFNLKFKNFPLPLYILVGAILLLFWMIIGSRGFPALLIVSGVYSYLWTKLTWQYDGIEDNWIGKLGFYKTFKKHYNSHKANLDKNFGYVITYTDSIFGTKI